MARIDGVSIILTSYNYERYVGKALASAIAQDAPNLEIIVVDNASTDGSWEIISELARQDPRVAAHRNPENIGMIGNHNRGLELATKERVLFLSADDYLLPGHISRLLEAHERHPEIDYFFTSYVHVDENDRFKEYLGHIGHLHGTYYGGRNEFADLLSHDVYMCTPTVLLPRTMMIERGGFSSAVTTSDYELFLSLASTGATFGFLQTASVAVRIHSEEFTGKDKYIGTGRQLEDHLWILEEYCADRFRDKFAGHENSIVRLLNAKVANLLRYPGGEALYEPYATRVEALRQRLRELSVEAQKAPLPASPLFSVVAMPSADVDGLRRIREQLDRQTHQRWELIFASQGAPNNAPLMLERAGTGAKHIEYNGIPTHATALNDMLSLAAGDIVLYADGCVEWSNDHLRSIASALSDPRIGALCVPVDLRIGDASAEPMIIAEFFGGRETEANSAIGEAVPLDALAHRTRILDRTGRFEELPYLMVFDFVQRILVQTPLGIPETLRLTHDSRPAGIADLPATEAYLQSLALIYQARPSPASTAVRQEHFRRIAAFLRGPETLRAALADVFDVLRRGPVIPKTHSGQDVVLLGADVHRDAPVAQLLAQTGVRVTYCHAHPVDPETQGLVQADRRLFPPGERMAFVLAALASETDVFWLSDRHYEDLLRAILDVLGAASAVILPGERSPADHAHREIRYAPGLSNIEQVRDLLGQARLRGSIPAGG